MIDLALYSHAVSSFTQALYLRYFLEEPGRFPFQGGPIFLLGHRKLAEVCGDPFACPPLGRHISYRMSPRPLSTVVLNTPRDSAPITSPQEIHLGRPILLGSCERVLNFEAKGFTDRVWKNPADTKKLKLSRVFPCQVDSVEVVSVLSVH